MVGSGERDIANTRGVSSFACESRCVVQPTLKMRIRYTMRSKETHKVCSNEMAWRSTADPHVVRNRQSQSRSASVVGSAAGSESATPSAREAALQWWVFVSVSRILMCRRRSPVNSGNSSRGIPESQQAQCKALLAKEGQSGPRSM